MRIVVLAAAAALTLAGFAPSARAQSAADRADARCILVLNVLTRDAQRRDAAAKGIYFYLGRISARGPVSRLEQILVGENALIRSGQQAQAELGRCGAEIGQRSSEMEAIMKKLAATAPRPAAAPKAK